MTKDWGQDDSSLDNCPREGELILQAALCRKWCEFHPTLSKKYKNIIKITFSNKLHYYEVTFKV